MNSTHKTLISRGGIDGVIHGATGPGLLDKCQKLDGYKTIEFKVTLSNKLPAKYVFRTVNSRGKNDYKLNDFYKSCLQKVVACNVKSIAFYCEAIAIPGFELGKAAKLALGTAHIG